MTSSIRTTSRIGWLILRANTVIACANGCTGQATICPRSSRPTACRCGIPPCARWRGWRGCCARRPAMRRAKSHATWRLSAPARQVWPRRFTRLPKGSRPSCWKAMPPAARRASSSFIENFFGFPTGVRGGDLTYQAQLQAYRFGAKICHARPGAYIDLHGRGARRQPPSRGLRRDAARQMRPHRDRRPSTAGWRPRGARISKACRSLLRRDRPGGRALPRFDGNRCRRRQFGGPGAMFLSEGAEKVVLVIRGEVWQRACRAICRGASRPKANIEILTRTEIRKMMGGKALEAAELENTHDGERRIIRTPAVFSMIGAITLHQLAAARNRARRKGIHQDRPCGRRTRRRGKGRAVHPGRWRQAARNFCCRRRTVRLGKRCAAAVGEGGMAVEGVHEVLGTYA